MHHLRIENWGGHHRPFRHLRPETWQVLQTLHYLCTENWGGHHRPFRHLRTENWRKAAQNGSKKVAAAAKSSLR